MIVRCPLCSSRHDSPPLRTGSGAAMVDCHVCGHEWIEGDVLEVVPEPPASRPAGDIDADQLAEAARLARFQFDATRRSRRRRAFAWAGLVAAAILPVLVTMAVPEKVVAAVPASIRLYDWLGREVNIYGLEIRQLDLQNLIVDGKKVIAVKGELTNVTSSERKLPWLRFGLRSKDNAEVYHWTLDTDARPLRAGESTSFVTRLASPPANADRLEIRFARADEIGSNKGHE